MLWVGCFCLYVHEQQTARWLIPYTVRRGFRSAVSLLCQIRVRCGSLCKEARLYVTLCPPYSLPNFTHLTQRSQLLRLTWPHIFISVSVSLLRPRAEGCYPVTWSHSHVEVIHTVLQANLTLRRTAFRLVADLSAPIVKYNYFKARKDLFKMIKMKSLSSHRSA